VAVGESDGYTGGISGATRFLLLVWER
jgi:hypothetical protein